MRGTSDCDIPKFLATTFCDAFLPSFSITRILSDKDKSFHFACLLTPGVSDREVYYAQCFGKLRVVK